MRAGQWADKSQSRRKSNTPKDHQMRSYYVYWVSEYEDEIEANCEIMEDIQLIATKRYALLLAKKREAKTGLPFFVHRTKVMHFADFEDEQ